MTTERKDQLGLFDPPPPLPLEREAIARDAALDLLELHRPNLVAIGKATALQLVLANGQVSCPEVLQHMRANGHAAAMDAVDPRWSGAISSGFALASSLALAMALVFALALAATGLAILAAGLA